MPLFALRFSSKQLGSLRWAYPELDEKPPIVCGYLVSKVHIKEGSTISKSKGELSLLSRPSLFAFLSLECG